MNPSEINQQTQAHEQLSALKQQATNKALSYDSFEHLSALEIICKIIHRNYSRHFLKRLMFAYIQSLKKPQHHNESQYTTDSESNYWKQYLIKKRNPEEQEWFQFLNLCAQMIQSKFRSYITKKRHQFALKKTHRAKDLIASFLKRWKIYRIFNCQKITSIRGKIKEIQAEIDAEQQKMGQRDGKKLKALYKYSQINAKIFTDTFNLLRQTGMWTLQKNMKKRPIIKNIQPKRIKGQEIQVKYLAFVQKRQEKISYNENRKQNVDQNASNQFINEFAKSINSSSLQDRPIKAAGQYKFNQSQVSQNATVGSQVQRPVEQNNKQINRKERDRKKQQLNKRIKYDPKKAIEQQKNRKKQQVKTEVKDIPKLPTQSHKQMPTQTETQIVKKSEGEKKKNKPQKQFKQVVQAEVKVKQVKVEPKLAKKISSKIDCWGSKKQAEPEWVKDYKSRILENKIQSVQKSDDLKRSLEKNKKQLKNDSFINATRLKQHQTSNQEIPTKTQVSNTYQRGFNANWKNKEKEIQILRMKQEQFVGQRKNSSQNFQEQIKSLVDRKSKKKQVHRPIQQLEETYNKHYGDRYRNLMPKLSLLAVARSQEREGSIPILEDLSQQFSEWFQQLYSSTQYWKVASQHDRIFKSFLIS